jgi:hypothetical protein
VALAVLVAGSAFAQTPPPTTTTTPAPAPVKDEPKPEPPKGPNQGALSLSAGADVATAYFFRGIRQETDGWIVQPYGELGFKLYEGSGAFTNLALTFGTWNSLHGGRSGIEGSGSDPKSWYESDFYTRLSATFFEALTGQILYTAYMSPNDSFATVQEIAFGVSLNDSAWLGAFAFNPSILLAKEVKNQADAGSDKGLYLQLGLAPGYTFNFGTAYPVTLSLPILLGLSLKDYYEFGTGEDDTFGYFQMGLAASVPLAFIPASFGSWQLKGSANWLHLGDNLRAVNRNDRNEFIGTIGIAFTY